MAAEDLERLAVSAYLIGRDQDYAGALDRAYEAHIDGGRAAPAARCAFWLGLHAFLQGQAGRATGWLGRAKRVLDRGAHDCVERGYLMLPLAERQLQRGRPGSARTTAARAAAIGERFRDHDLIACARHVEGRALLARRRLDDGLALLDEAMLAVTAGELSPIMTGLIYCSVIDACRHAYAVERAREWTHALAHWCDEQPQMAAFAGACQVHRAEIKLFHGAWLEALEDARRCGDRCRNSSRTVAAAALYQQGDLHRLRGDFAAAEHAYRTSAAWGCEPQPGMALLRLAQRRGNAAAATIRRVLNAARDPFERTRLLPAYVEIVLAAGDVSAAREGSRELEQTAARLNAVVLHAMAASARGSVELAEGNAQAALASLRRAVTLWNEVEAPYPAACARSLLALACGALGDKDGAALELDACRLAFQQLGAAPDVARIDALASTPAAQAAGLTLRELQVLRLVSEGKTNRAIAAELSRSERTVDRHLCNILTKLGAPSRAAATAYAYEHHLFDSRSMQ
ncbi:MAG TPA: LuxR C-terminal-related transcriptional regulator [Casimicrobiaceae bacterium]|nr:LuxR C-terminal-related transcriptional regulator [Casimicrobiaceae bacterium]